MAARHGRSIGSGAMLALETGDLKRPGTRAGLIVGRRSGARRRHYFLNASFALAVLPSRSAMKLYFTCSLLKQ